VIETEAKEELIEAIGWTLDMLRQEMKKALSMSGVFVLGDSEFRCVKTKLETGGPCAWVNLDVTKLAADEWDKRIQMSIDLLRSLGLTVEHSSSYDAVTASFKHHIVAAHEYRGCVQD
jgi:hypothetical protein